MFLKTSPSSPSATLHYPRHFMLLAGIAAVLAAASPWRLHGPVASFGLYGALHALTVVLTLRALPSLRRRLLFIAIAASLSMLSAAVGLYGSHFIGTLPGTAGPFLLLALSSGFGAASYAVLVRRFWIAKLSRRSLVSITLGCVLATLVVLTLGILLGTIGSLWLALSWWFAFSTGLWYREAT